MHRFRASVRFSALAIGLVALTACTSSGSTATEDPGSTRPARDELSPAMDNGAKGRSAFSASDHEPPTRVCRDTVRGTDQSLVIRALPDGPRAPDGTLAFTSGVCIYLPPGYASATTRYPVIYLLHGAGEDAGAPVAQGQLQTTMDDLIAKDPDAAAIVVMPDGTDGQWYDGFDGSIRNETYVTAHLIPYVDRHFRTIAKRSGRAITGVSNGGFGAILIAEKHPELFLAAGGMSSNLDWLGARGLAEPGGPFYRANHPVELVDALDDTDVILDIASTCTSTGPADDCRMQGLDQTFLPANRAFAAMLRQVPGRRAALDYRESDGAHEWATWTEWLGERQLPFFLGRLADPRS